MKKNIFILEDHDEALKVWREKGIKNLDLVHLDAHLDFGFHQARPVQKILEEARSIKELRSSLEYSLSFSRFEKDFNKQTNIGNYIYPAIEEGRVKNFYWVIPGKQKDFEKAAKSVKDIYKNIIRRINQKTKFTICALEKLPVLKQKVLLDIDTDFLVIDSLLNANNTAQIGKRKPWILPRGLTGILKKKIKQPHIITIAYSVNGGYTPMKFKQLGDEIAYYFAPREFKSRFENNTQAARYFNLFCATNQSKYYQKAIRFNPAYRAMDNNYGPLYLSLRKFSLAQREFLKILKADPKNPACLLGLGNIALEKRDSKKAKRYFSLALRYAKIKKPPFFRKLQIPILSGLARAELGLQNFKKAKELLVRYQAKQPLQPYSYYLLGIILEKEGDFLRASLFYQDTLRLGFFGIEPIWRLLRISCYLQEKDAIIKFVIIKYREFKKEFIKLKKWSLKKGKKIRGMRNICEKMAILNRRLKVT